MDFFMLFDRWMFWTREDQVFLAVVLNCTDSVIIKYSHSHLTVYFIKKFCGKHFTGAVRALSWIRIGTITTKGMNWWTAHGLQNQYRQHGR
jgi:hypothetical protein